MVIVGGQLFERATYDDLLLQDKSVLGQDLQSLWGTVLVPGQSASLSQPLNPDTQFVGVAAFFRQADGGAGWKAVIRKDQLDADVPSKIELIDQRLVMNTGQRTR